MGHSMVRIELNYIQVIVFDKTVIQLSGQNAANVN